MKKKLIATVCASLVAFSLVSCGGEEKKAEDKKDDKPAAGQEVAGAFKKGTYEAETKVADDKGNKAKMVITVGEDGKISDVKYNEYSEKDNVNKRDNEEYNKKMKEVSGTNPKEAEPAIEKQIKDKQSAEIDTVTGATGTSGLAKQLAEAAIANAKEGKTDKALVEAKK
ncbi:MAG: FMN-binding protein [Sarcina sp.]